MVHIMYLLSWHDETKPAKKQMVPVRSIWSGFGKYQSCFALVNDPNTNQLHCFQLPWENNFSFPWLRWYPTIEDRCQLINFQFALDESRNYWSDGAVSWPRSQWTNWFTAVQTHSPTTQLSQKRTVIGYWGGARLGFIHFFGRSDGSCGK